MKENAFTLIELLGVIVILAIISLIATPVILGIINDTKKETDKISVENYIDAVEQAIVRENINNVFKPSECTINNGNVNCLGYNKLLQVEIDGEEPISGTIKTNDGSVSKGTELIFTDYKAIINDEGNLIIENIDSK